MEQQQAYPAPRPGDGTPPYRSRNAPTNVLAVVSLVLGVGSFVPAPFGPLVSLPAVITGYIARRQIAHHGESGTQFARWGLVLGYVNLGLTSFVFALGAIVYALASYHVTVAGHPLY